MAGGALTSRECDALLQCVKDDGLVENTITAGFRSASGNDVVPDSA